MLALLKRHFKALGIIAAALAVTPSYLWPYKLTGASEAPSILVGDTFLVNRAAYDLRVMYTGHVLLHIGAPRRGDIVLAELPTHKPIVGIKRVIGLPGETIEVRENRTIINGKPLPLQPLGDQSFDWVPTTHRMGTTVVMEDGHWCAYTPGKSEDRNAGPVQLGAGEYFLMGDNRDNSLDSRAFGPVARERIFGKVITVLPTGRRLAKR